MQGVLDLQSDEHRRLLLVPNGGVAIRHARHFVQVAQSHLRTWLRESNDFCFVFALLCVDFTMITRIWYTFRKSCIHVCSTRSYFLPIEPNPLLDNHPDNTGFTLGFSLTRHNVSGRRAQEHATSGKTARAPTSHSLHSPTAGGGGHLHEAEIMRPWTNCISLTLSCILAGFQENVYVGHRRD